uniref:RING-type domain-containing protein n=1 Tax=Brassica campestris TaxID=3711 RepID=M4FF02_BRACM
MRCNACWRELEGRAISTTCGHLLCTEDASKILSNDGACPVCDQVLSKSLMKPVDTNPNEEWVNMAMAGISPQIRILFVNVVLFTLGISCSYVLQLNSVPLCLKSKLKCVMKSAYRSIMFYVSQRDLEMQCKMNRVVAQCRQKCEGMQAMLSEKMEKAHAAYQKVSKRCQMMEQEVENLTKDKQELQEKFSEKSRQKRKLDEMYDQLRSEYETVKRTAIQPANNFYPRHQEPDFFSNAPVSMMENREPIRRDRSFFSPATPGPKDEMWPARQNSSNSGPFDISNNSPAIPSDLGNRRAGGGHPVFGGGAGGGHHAFGGGGGGNANPQSTLRNLILSPIKRSQLSRSRPQLFT